MRIYARGDKIPPELRGDRIASKASELKYWLLLPNGKPDPNEKPFLRKWNVELFHKAHPELGDYKIITGSVGRPNTGFDMATYDRLRNATPERKRSTNERRQKKGDSNA